VRLLLDTNVLVSAVLFGGLPQSLVEQAFRGEYELVTSEAMLDEFEEVLRESFARPRLVARALREELASISDISRPQPIPRVSRDPADDMVLAAALGGHADAIVTGDRDLLDLGAYGGMPVLTTRQALAKLAGIEDS
jgi:putative PIN family toxin of toxin-antitoxin system